MLDLVKEITAPLHELPSRGMLAQVHDGGLAGLYWGIVHGGRMARQRGVLL